MAKLSFRRIRALIKKERFQIVRDPSSILITVVLPLFLLFIYGYGVSLDLNHVPIGVVLEDTAPDAQSFLQSLMDSTYFDVRVVRDRQSLMRPLTEGEIRGFVVIPSYFSNYRNHPDRIAPLQVIADGSEPNTAAFVQNYVAGALANWLEQEKISSNLKGLPKVTSEARFWYNPELKSRNFLLSGSLAIIMTLIGTLLTALVVAREWERGTMEALMSTPVKIVELVIGKLIPYFLLGMISMALCVLVSIVLYGLPLRGSLLLLFAVSALFLIGAVGLGLLISTTAKNQLVAYQVSVMAGFLPSYILSGFLFEISSMPLPIQCITYFIPARYFVQCLQTLFLVGNVWKLILFNMIPMTLIALAFFGLTAKKTVKRLD